MRTFLYTAKTPLEALRKATLELGDDCILIETKEISRNTPNKETIYKVLIGVKEEFISNKEK
ncbi:MAG: hypothetical protein QM490_05295 [Candidatus Gracilibacteria bacterium]